MEILKKENFLFRSDTNIIFLLFQICETSSSMTLNFTDLRTKIYKKLRGFLERKSSLRESRVNLFKKREGERNNNLLINTLRYDDYKSFILKLD